MRNIVCVISGRGSNLEALLRAERAGRWRERLDAGVAAVISNRPQARGLDVAREAGVAAQVLDHARFASREEFERALAAAIDAHAPSLVVLAGFMRVLGAAFVARYEGRMINIHPSLLPAFAGLDTHRRALASGTRIHGATVHFVSPEVDGGAIIAQAAVPVLPGDTESVLAARVLAAEHRLLPRVVELVLDGRVALREGRIAADGVDAAEFLAFEAQPMSGNGPRGQASGQPAGPMLHVP
ncbi:MAG TPA: phosphoribosylglycinamide formyltransferase [Burkholderiaceae bacterium]|nr:phosphoribosylglycinamide formyltransferase [Burkholderiaceae bacterium]